MSIISYNREIEEKKLTTLKAKLNDLSYHDHILRKEMNMLELDDDKRDDYISDIKYNIRCIQDTEDAIKK